MARTAPPGPDAPHASRRSLVRGAALAAWAAPVITVASAAPAFAVSNPMGVNSTIAVIRNGLLLSTRVTVVNSSATVATTALSVTVEFAADLGGMTDDIISPSTTEVWSSPAAGTLTDGGKTMTVVFTKVGGVLAPGETSQFSLYAKATSEPNPLNTPLSSGTASAVPNPTPGTGTSSSTPWA